MDAHPELPAVDAVLHRVVERTSEPGQHLTVSGPVGAGQRTLAYRLESQHGAVVVELPDIRDADASAHLAYKLSRHADVPVDPSAPIDTAIRTALPHLREHHRVVVLLPATWSLEHEARNPDRHGFERRAQRALAALLAQQHVATIVMGPRPERLHLGHLPFEFLPRASASVSWLATPSLWGAYADAASRIAHALPSRHTVHPVRLRLGVGVAALTAHTAQRVATELAVDGQIETFVDDITRVAADDPALHEALWRFTLLRAPLPKAAFLEAVRPPPGHEPLFTSCLAYGEDLVRSNATIRRALRTSLRRWGPQERDRKAVHASLAEAHAQLDGQLDPNATTQTTIDYWLEKVHHLAHAGSLGAETWSRQENLRPELLWARARQMSLAGDYDGAAELFSRCTELDGEDDYAWHYLGFNLDQAGEASSRTEAAFRTARRLDPSNPWWNSRLVTYLTEQGRHGEAEHAWRDAVRDVTDSGAELVTRPEIALHLHRWVVKAWLDIGDVKRARAVFDEIPDHVQTELPELETRLVDAEEALAQGETVRPPQMPAHERWQMLTALPDEDLLAWYPARVRDADRDSVELVLALPAAEPARRRLFRKHVPVEEWNRACNVPPRPGMYVEIGEYPKRRILVMPLPPRWPGRSALESRDLRHLRWSAKHA